MTNDEIDHLLQPVRAALLTVTAPSPPPSTVHRLSADDLVYMSTFRLPRGSSNGQSFEFGGSPLALDADRQTLFVGTRGGFVAEVAIPDDHMAFAEYVQGFAELTDGKMAALRHDASLAGLLVVGEQLLGTVSIYYDANGEQRASHFLRSSDLSKLGASDLFAPWIPERTGFVAGYLAHVPLEWQNRLWGDILTGQFGIPIVHRTSLGPAAVAIDRAIYATPLVYYDGDHPTLGPWAGSNPTYGATTNAGGLVLIDGTRTALFFGRNGTGTYRYGVGTNRRELDSLPHPDGGDAVWCYDPADSGKGPHAWPYRYQVWAYDLEDFAAVAAGTKQPWEIVPYGVWPLEFPTADPAFTGIGGVAYDPTTRQLYISQLRADGDESGYAARAYIHVFTVKAAA